eukprot:s964_g19.t1
MDACRLIFVSHCCESRLDHPKSWLSGAAFPADSVRCDAAMEDDAGLNGCPREFRPISGIDACSVGLWLKSQTHFFLGQSLWSMPFLEGIGVGGCRKAENTHRNVADSHDVRRCIRAFSLRRRVARPDDQKGHELVKLKKLCTGASRRNELPLAAGCRHRNLRSCVKCKGHTGCPVSVVRTWVKPGRWGTRHGLESLVDEEFSFDRRSSDENRGQLIKDIHGLLAGGVTTEIQLTSGSACLDGDPVAPRLGRRTMRPARDGATSCRSLQGLSLAK